MATALFHTMLAPCSSIADAQPSHTLRLDPHASVPCVLGAVSGALLSTIIQAHRASDLPLYNLQHNACSTRPASPAIRQEVPQLALQKVQDCRRLLPHKQVPALKPLHAEARGRCHTRPGLELARAVPGVARSPQRDHSTVQRSQAASEKSNISRVYELKGEVGVQAKQLCPT